MAKTEAVHARLDSQLKANVEKILTQLGLTPSDVVNLLYRQIELNGGLPFELKIPNYSIEDEIYSEVMKSVDEMKNGAKPKPAADVFERLEAKYAR